MSRRSSLLTPRRLGAAAAAVALGVGALLAGGGAAASASAPAHTTAATPRLPKIGHVWTIILENKSYEATFTGLNQNDYLWKTLPSYGELLRQYYGTGHFSLDNYISLVSGQAPAPANQADCPQYTERPARLPGRRRPGLRLDRLRLPQVGVKTLFNQLDAGGRDAGRSTPRTWATTRPARTPTSAASPAAPPAPACPTRAARPPTDQYVPKHNPAPWFHSLIDNPSDCANVVPLDGLGRRTPATRPMPEPGRRTSSSEATTPRFSWISPNNCSRRARRHLQGRQPLR